jgi:hypothetical protein
MKHNRRGDKRTGDVIYVNMILHRRWSRLLMSTVEAGKISLDAGWNM